VGQDSAAKRKNLERALQRKAIDIRVEHRDGDRRGITERMKQKRRWLETETINGLSIETTTRSSHEYLKIKRCAFISAGLSVVVLYVLSDGRKLPGFLVSI
jgi:hypothetical protein